jgi:negative regulator of the PHO system
MIHCRLHDVLYHPNEVILTLEYMDCNLRELLKNSGPLSLVLVKSFTHQILQGVAYAKTKRCVHRDLKPANVLVMPRQGIVKLADYGLGRAHDFSGGRYTRQVSAS